MQSHELRIGDLTMRWEEAGEGTPVVFVHGIPTSPALWRHVVPLVGRARCLAWEMVGYGASIPHGEGRDISVSQQAEYMVDWLRALGIERAVFVGHDLGGGVAHIAALRHPELCAGLLLTNAIGYDSWPIPSVTAMQKTRALVSRLPNPAMKMTMATLFRRGHDDAAQAKAAMETHWPHYARHGAGASMARQVAALDVRDTLDVVEALPKLDIPARIVWGVADQFQKIDYGERFARDLRAPLTRIEGGKHFTPEDHPREIAAALGSLLEEVALGDSRTARRALDRDDSLEQAYEALAALPEVMPEDASPPVREIYEDIKAVLHVPFVNYLFRVMASDPDYLERSWAQLRPILLSQAFEDAASELRAVGRAYAAGFDVPGDMPQDVPKAARAFTESIDYVLPKLVMIATLLVNRATKQAPVSMPDLPEEGITEGTRKVPMVDPAKADPDVAGLLDEIRKHHGHPTVATYFRSLAQWPELLETIWTRLQPHVAGPGYAEARERLIAKAEELSQSLPPVAVTPPPGLGQALDFLRRRQAPDLQLDTAMVRHLVFNEENPRNAFDPSGI